MTSQKAIFATTEADAWFRRNAAASKTSVGSGSIAARLLSEAGMKPRRVLEIGCSDGSRLEELRIAFGCECFGVDPSQEAVESGSSRYPSISLSVGTADKLPYESASFDTVVFGFCLYLCDRQDLFKIGFEADRCLADPGALVITDFLPPFPYRNTYAHHPGVYSYKLNYSGMFTWNPAYSELARTLHLGRDSSSPSSIDARVASILLRKDGADAYTSDPFKTERAP